MKSRWWVVVGLLLLHATAGGQTGAPSGSVTGHASAHDVASSAGVIADANVALPSSVTGGDVFFGKWRDAPKTSRQRAPVVVFLHGSSGLGLKAIEEWQRWLAGRGVASVAPDSFALPDRLTYKSPVSKEVYEKIHALRASEIEMASAALKAAAWADPARMMLAGTSEGAVAVARYRGSDFRGRMIFAWSCEDNYFVQDHRTAIPAEQPVLNVISSTDPFFSPANAWLGNSAANGHCADMLRGHRQAVVLLIPGAPHTLLNLPPVRHATAGFVDDVLRP